MFPLPFVCAFCAASIGPCPPVAAPHFIILLAFSFSQHVDQATKFPNANPQDRRTMALVQDVGLGTQLIRFVLYHVTIVIVYLR